MYLLFLLFFLGPTLVASTRSVYLEEVNGQTVTVPIDSRVVNEFGKQILSIMKLEKAPEATAKPDGRVEQYMTELYRQMEGNSRSNAIYKYQAADHILSIPVAAKLLDSSIIELQYSPSDLQENKQPLSIAQLVLYLSHSQSVSVEILQDRFDSIHPNQESLLQPGDDSITLDATQLLLNKKKNPEESSTFYVRIHSEISDVSVLEAFIVVGFGDDSGTPEFQKRVRRSADGPQSTNRPATSDKSNEPLQGTYNDGCVKKALYVDFKELGWDTWVIAPTGYSASYCEGSCTFPLHEKTNTSNHAVVQTLVHMVHPDRAEQAKCVPTSLTPLKILFTDEKKHVNINKYMDMSAEECGCR